MAITYPRPLPICAFNGECSFQLKRNQSRSLTGAGSPNAAEVAPAMWEAKYRTKILGRAAFADVGAWLESLRGGLRTFRATVPRHRWPLAYPRGFSGLTVSGSPFSGSGTLTSVGSGRDTITVGGLPAGFILSVGDWLSIPVGSRQRLHRILEGGSASGLGAVNLTVEPVIDPAVVTSGDPVPVLFDAPWCDMVLSAPFEMPRDPVRGGSVSFEGLQVLI